jgi:hypothetical protein
VSFDKIALEVQNQGEVKIKPPEKIILQAQNQSKVKYEPLVVSWSILD